MVLYQISREIMWQALWLFRPYLSHFNLDGVKSKVSLLSSIQPKQAGTKLCQAQLKLALSLFCFQLKVNSASLLNDLKNMVEITV